MRSKVSSKNRKFFKGIYLWIAAVICLLVTFFSVTIYYNVKKNVVENNYSLNKQTLYQMKYNTTYMNETVKHLILSIYLGTEADYLMHVDDADNNIFDSYLTLNEITTSIINNNPLVQSVYVYNPHEELFFSTYKGMFYKDEELMNALKTYKTVPMLEPIVRKGQDSKRNDEVFTYAMYDSSSPKGVFDGAVFVNVNADLIINNLKSINNSDAESEFFLLSDKRQIINQDSSNQGLQEPVLQLFDSKIKKSIEQGEQYGYLIDRIDGRDYFVTYMYIEGADWVLIQTQHLSDVLKYMNKIQLSILMMTIIFLTLSLLVSFTLSKRIYRPIGHLVQRMRSEKLITDGDDSNHDEIVFLNQSYSKFVELITAAQSNEHDNLLTLKNYYLRNLLIDSEAASDKELNILNEHSRLSLDFDGNFVVCVVKIDNYQSFKDSNSSRDVELYKYAIVNISYETLAQMFINESLDMKRDHFAIIAYSELKDRDALYRNLHLSMVELQNNIANFLGFSITVSLGSVVEEIHELSQSYHIALSNSNYRYVLGKNMIIAPDLVDKQNQSHELSYSVHLEKKLIEEMKSNNLDAAENTMFTILQEISGQAGSHITFSVMLLIRTIMTTVFEMNDFKYNQSMIDIDAVYSKFIVLETIDEIYEEMKSLLRRMISAEKYQVYEKHNVIVETIKDSIQKNYPDLDLSLQKLGTLFKMSPAYLGQIFKGQMGMSVASYINEVRIVRAQEWLETSNLSVTQIMDKVGIANETSFYRLFKKRFGCSPKEYAFIKSIQEK